MNHASHSHVIFDRKYGAGSERGAKRDAVLLNAGAALYVGGKVASLKEGVRLAAEIIDSDAAQKKLEAFRQASQG